MTVHTLDAAGRTKHYTVETRDGLIAYRTARNLTLKELARELNSNETQVSKYLSGKPEGDVLRLESVIVDVLAQAERRISQYAEEVYETAQTRQVFTVLEIIRKTNDVGLLHGPAGVGKSSGATLYAERNPSAIRVTCNAWTRDVGGIEGLIFRRVQHRSWTTGIRRGDYLVEKLTGSNRLIIVDNAHRLTRQSLAWLFDFHDATRCPIGLIGNPEVLDVIRTNDQQFSRIGLCREVRIKDGKEAEEAARLYLQSHAPELADDLLVAAMDAVQRKGHVRTLAKQLALARELMEHPRFSGKPEEAFETAQTQLVNTEPRMPERKALK